MSSSVVDVARRNSYRVYEFFRDRPEEQWTVADVALATQLSVPTVARACERHEHAGWLSSEVTPIAPVGRPPRSYRYLAAGHGVLAIDAFEDVALRLSDLAGRTVTEVIVSGADGDRPELLAGRLTQLLDGSGSVRRRVHAVAVAVPDDGAAGPGEDLAREARAVLLREGIDKALPGVKASVFPGGRWAALTAAREDGLSGIDLGVYIHGEGTSLSTLVVSGRVYHGVQGRAGDFRAVSTLTGRLPGAQDDLEELFPAGAEAGLAGGLAASELLASSIVAAYDPEAVVLSDSVSDRTANALRQLAQMRGGSPRVIRSRWDRRGAVLRGCVLGAIDSADDYSLVTELSSGTAEAGLSRA